MKTLRPHVQSNPEEFARCVQMLHGKLCAQSSALNCEVQGANDCQQTPTEAAMQRVIQNSDMQGHSHAKQFMLCCFKLRTIHKASLTPPHERLQLLESVVSNFGTLGCGWLGRG